MTRATLVSATDFARGLSDYLSQAQYGGREFDIARGKKVIARLSPGIAAKANEGAQVRASLSLAELDDLLANGPKLSLSDAAEMAAQLRGMRGTVARSRNPWQDDQSDQGDGNP